MKTKILSIIALLAVCYSVKAQTSPMDSRFELGLHGGFGLNGLLYEGGGASASYLFGGDIDFYFLKNVGISVGADLTNYSSSITLDETISQNTGYPGLNNEGTYKAVFEGWTEKQELLALEIPISLKLRFASGGNAAWVIGIGGKFMSPINATAEISEGVIKASYEDLTNGISYPETSQGMEHHNIGTLKYGDYEYKTDLTGKSCFAAKFDAGQELGTGICRFYWGIYFSYGFGDAIESEHTKDVIDFGNGVGTVIESNRVDKVTPIAVGLKVGVKLGL